MYQGTASLDALVPNAPEVSAPAAEPFVLQGAEMLQFTYEVAGADIEALLPPALHPTIPMLAQWLCWSVPHSPWGTFNLCMLRLSCRSGARPRTFLRRSVIDNAAAGVALAAGWGFNAAEGQVAFRRNYDCAEVRVIEGGRTTLAAKAVDPDPLNPSDLQFFSAMHAARLPQGFRLIQFDSAAELSRAERYRPEVQGYDAAAWGDAAIRPDHPVTAFGAGADISLLPVRFLCQPDQLAFTGTERVGQSPKEIEPTD